MTNERTSKLQAILKVANVKKQAVAKVPVGELLHYAQSRQAKKACAAAPPSLYCRLTASMKKTAEAEKKESPKSEASKPESPKPAAPKPTAPKSTTSQTGPPPPATGQGTAQGFDWQSILQTLQPYAAPIAIGVGAGTLGSLMLPRGTRSGESAMHYQRRQRNRMIGGGLAGGGTAAALLAAYNAYKARKVASIK